MRPVPERKVPPKLSTETESFVDPTQSVYGAAVVKMLFGGVTPYTLEQLADFFEATLTLYDAIHDPKSPHYGEAFMCEARSFDPAVDQAAMSKAQAIQAAFDTGVPASKAPAFVRTHSGEELQPAAAYQWYWRKRKELASAS